MSKPNYRATVSFDVGAQSVHRPRARARALQRRRRDARRSDRPSSKKRSTRSSPTCSRTARRRRARSTKRRSRGELTAKVSKLLHRDLAYQARSEGIDLDHLVGELLAAAMESRKQNRGVRSGNSRPREDHQPHDNVGNRFDGGGPRRRRGFGGRGNNAHLLDDRANFIEYVRGLEQGNGSGRAAAVTAAADGGGAGRRRSRSGAIAARRRRSRRQWSVPATSAPNGTGRRDPRPARS